MKNLCWPALLMVITILFVTGFQLYWLRQNYVREKRAMTIKAEVAFRETIMSLQADRLDLDALAEANKDSAKGKLHFIVKDENGEQVKLKMKPGKNLVSTIDVIRTRLRDSVRVKANKPPMIISMTKKGEEGIKDSNRISIRKNIDGRIYNILYSMDLSRDSLRLSQVDSAYHNTLAREKLDIPFHIEKLNGERDSDNSFDEVTVGFANPMTYKLVLGNTLPYLMRQILQPILFSILLLGITVFSFLLLYRNLVRQKKLAALKNEFISNITHELKTPIATVGVAIEALQNFNAINDPGRTKEYLDISKNELQRLALLVDKVLKLSMFEKQELELKYETVDMGSVVQEVADSLKLQLEKRRASLTIRRDGDLLLEGDRLHLLSVVFNLIDNAIKYSKEDPVIDVSLSGRSSDIELRVSDRGIGIPPEYRLRVFEKFFRIPHGDAHDAKGYGLGLSYVAQVIGKHHGTISIGGDGTGTTMDIKIPRVQPGA